MKNKKIVILAILVAFAIPMSTQIPAAGIQNVAESFPDASETTVALIVTLPILVASLFALIAGKVAGSVIEFKKLILAALVFFTAGGVAPFFFSESLGLVLAFRVVCGIGIGLLSPLGATLVVKLIDSEEAQGKAMGIGSIVLNISGIVYVSLAGALADSH